MSAMTLAKVGDDADTPPARKKFPAKDEPVNFKSLTFARASTATTGAKEGCMNDLTSTIVWDHRKQKLQ